MISPNIISQIYLSFFRYRHHFFVFLIALFISLTLAHPSVLINDEFITTNQLRQLHEGHQIIVNEGKYGLQENGSMSAYFGYRSNILGYPIVLPLLSLPAHWIIDLSGEHCAYLILCLWTMILLFIILFINHYYQDFSYIGRWKWTPAGITFVFVLFFVNLFYYSTFPVGTINTYPEIIAIVFTNMVFLSIAAVLIYEIIRTIFEDPGFSFFGTLVCLFSSSYFLWATHCKDHILVIPVFTAIFLSLIRLAKTDDHWYLPLAFIFTGLLAWIRPEIGLSVFLIVFLICCYTLFQYKSEKKPFKELLFVFFSPMFTIIGALPFFLNNYLITKNFLLPVQSLYLSQGTAPLPVKSIIRTAGVRSVDSVIMMFVPKVPETPQTVFTDIIGIFFFPQTENIGIFALTPLFFAMSILGVILFFFRKLHFSSEEKKFLCVTVFVAASVFLAYASQTHLLNTDFGIAPDIRYLSPMYIPLTVFGLIILRKIHLLPESPVDLLKKMFIVGTFAVLFSMTLLPFIYTANTVNIIKGMIPLAKFFSIYTFALVMLLLVIILWGLYRNRVLLSIQYLLLLICLVPFLWQVNAIFLFRTYSAYAGYTFWIPIIRLIWEFTVIFMVIN